MIQQTSSKLPANVFKIRVNCWTFAAIYYNGAGRLLNVCWTFAGSLQEVCWTFAKSCKHPICDYLSVFYCKVRDSRKSRQKWQKNFCKNRKKSRQNQGIKLRAQRPLHKTQHPALATINTCSAKFSSVKFCRYTALKYIFVRRRHDCILSV